MSHTTMASPIDTRPSTATRAADQPERWAGLSLFVLAAQFMTVIMLAASIAPGYDYGSAAISDLGVIASTATMFNLSLIAVGVLNILGGIVLYTVQHRKGLLVVYAVAGLGAIGAGVFPLNTGAPHSLSAVLAFVFFNLEAIGSGLTVAGWMRWISVAAGIVGLLFTGVMVVGDSGNAAAFGAIGHGGAERMIVYPPMVWALAFGGYLIGRCSAPWNGRSMPVTSR
jgi:hypothetical membrane protein